MNFQKNIFLALFAVLVLGTSCTEKSVSLKDAAVEVIPANSAAVTAIDLKRIMDKADFPAIQKMEFYQAMISEVSSDNPGVVAVMKDPAQSGIDMEGRAYFVQDIDVMNPDNSVNVITLGLKDKAAFEKLVTNGNSNDVKSECNCADAGKG